MSLSSNKRKVSAGSGYDKTRIPKLPPIPQLMTTKDRFDNSPLLKYRRAEEMQNILASKV